MPRTHLVVLCSEEDARAEGRSEGCSCQCGRPDKCERSRCVFWPRHANALRQQLARAASAAGRARTAARVVAAASSAGRRGRRGRRVRPCHCHKSAPSRWTSKLLHSHEVSTPCCGVPGWWRRANPLAHENRRMPGIAVPQAVVSALLACLAGHELASTPRSERPDRPASPASGTLGRVLPTPKRHLGRCSASFALT
jgi:hypothetical protein